MARKRFIAGENSRNWRKRDCAEELLRAIEECEEDWCDDPAFKDVLFKLDRVEQELDILLQSPRRRQSLRQAKPEYSGTDSGFEHQEAPMKAQKSSG